MYIENKIKLSSNINDIISNPEYIENFKNILVDKYLQYLSTRDNINRSDKDSCANEYMRYSYLISIQNYIEKIISCIATISNIQSYNNNQNLT